MVNIREYLDYRRFLSDLLAERRTQGPAFSQRAILQRLNLKSTGYLSNLIAGRTELSLDLASRMGDLFGLSEAEQHLSLIHI